MMRDYHQRFPHLKQDCYQVTFDNGFELVVLPKPGFKETTAMLSVAVGGVDTVVNQVDKVVKFPEGVAHFLEHQIFENKGLEDFAQKFSRLGSDSNAFTGFTQTAYFFSGVDKVLDSLTLLLDLVSEARFTDQSVKKEIPIIKQELDLYADDPDHRLYTMVLAGLFPETPLAVDLAGTPDDLDKMTSDKLAEVFRLFYQPSFMRLVIVGDVPTEAVFEVVSERFAQQVEVEPPVLERPPLRYNPVVKKQSLQMDIALPKLGLGFRFPPGQEPNLYYKTALRLYLNLLVGWTSTAYQNWYDTGKIDDSFDIHLEVDQRFRFVMLLLDTTEPIGMSAKIKQVLKKGRASKDVSEAHLFALKKEMYGEFLMSLDRVDDLASLYLEQSDEQVSYLDFPDMLDQLSLDVVLSIGEQFFKTADAVDVTIFPN